MMTEKFHGWIARFVALFAKKNALFSVCGGMPVTCKYPSVFLSC